MYQAESSRAAPGAVHPDPLQAARSSAPLYRSLAAASETAGVLDAKAVEQLKADGLLAIFTPAILGGQELPPAQALRAVEEVAIADGSTAWVMMAIALCTGAAGAYLGESAIEQLFANGFPITAGQGIPNGRAEVVAGGYRLKGNWSYGSGTQHAEYIHTGAIVFEHGKPRLDAHGSPEVRIFYVPRSAVKMGGDWDVIGLRATASVDYSIDDLHVDEDWTYPARIAQPRRGGDLFRLGTIGIGALGHIGFALGVARHLLDEISALARERMGKPGSIASSESFLEKYAAMEARLRAARAFAYEVVGDGIPQPGTRTTTLIRLALNHVTSTGVEVANFVYAAAGGVSLRQGDLQRAVRDMLAGAQHVTSSPPILRECGKELAGLAENHTWAFLGLVPPRH